MSSSNAEKDGIANAIWDLLEGTDKETAMEVGLAVFAELNYALGLTDELPEHCLDYRGAWDDDPDDDDNITPEDPPANAEAKPMAPLPISETCCNVPC